MMKDSKIMPCICTESNNEKENMGKISIPIVCFSPSEHSWSCKCPDCRSGVIGFSHEKKLTYALTRRAFKKWNEFQKSLRNMK